MTLRLGSTGPDVTRLRERLGVPDEFGHILDQAVRAFQDRSGLVTDGIVGPKTLAELDKPDVTLPPEPPTTAAEKRNLVAMIARSWLGRSDADTVWRRVKYPGPPFPPYWCWAFLLMCWLEADVCDWDFSKGVFLLSSRLPTTKNPQVGDGVYFKAHQHHAVLVARDGDLCDWVNGNGEGGIVTLSEHKHITEPTAFYPIASLL